MKVQSNSIQANAETYSTIRVRELVTDHDNRVQVTGSRDAGVETNQMSYKERYDQKCKYQRRTPS